MNKPKRKILTSIGKEKETKGASTTVTFNFYSPWGTFRSSSNVEYEQTCFPTVPSIIEDIESDFKSRALHDLIGAKTSEKIIVHVEFRAPNGMDIKRILSYDMEAYKPDESRFNDFIQQIRIHESQPSWDDFRRSMIQQMDFSVGDDVLNRTFNPFRTINPLNTLATGGRLEDHSIGIVSLAEGSSGDALEGTIEFTRSPRNDSVQASGDIAYDNYLNFMEWGSDGEDYL